MTSGRRLCCEPSGTRASEGKGRGRGRQRRRVGRGLEGTGGHWTQACRTSRAQTVPMDAPESRASSPSPYSSSGRWTQRKSQYCVAWAKEGAPRRTTRRETDAGWPAASSNTALDARGSPFYLVPRPCRPRFATRWPLASWARPPPWPLVVIRLVPRATGYDCHDLSVMLPVVPPSSPVVPPSCPLSRFPLSTPLRERNPEPSRRSLLVLDPLHSLYMCIHCPLPQQLCLDLLRLSRSVTRASFPKRPCREAIAKPCPPKSLPKAMSSSHAFSKHNLPRASVCEPSCWQHATRSRHASRGRDCTLSI